MPVWHVSAYANHATKDIQNHTANLVANLVASPLVVRLLSKHLDVEQFPSLRDKNIKIFVKTLRFNTTSKEAKRAHASIILTKVEKAFFKHQSAQ